MYQITCDGHVLYDPRDEELSLIDPVCELAVNSTSSAHFTILHDHPRYQQLQKLKSVFTVYQDGEPIFRGRMTNDSRDFNNQLYVDLEGALGYTNDSIIKPFVYPDDMPPTPGNTVENFLRWVLTEHNNQVQPFQQIKVGTVTVEDPNNYIRRSCEEYQSTWDILKSRLLESQLGGYFVMRYEADGNYLDYFDEFPLTNLQEITFGENLLDLVHDRDATETYSVILPLGADLEDEGQVTIADLPDGYISADVVKSGLFIYSISAVEKYGWICCPVDMSTWDDVTEAANLQTKAVNQLTQFGVNVADTLTIQAIDLNCTDSQIESFRVGQNIRTVSTVHGVQGLFPLTELSISILSPQDTEITVGVTKSTLTDYNAAQNDNTTQRIEHVGQLVTGVQSGVSSLQQQVESVETSVSTTAETVVISALRDYAKTNDVETFRQYAETQLAVLSNRIDMNFETQTESISHTTDDVQRRFTELSKYIRFSIDGIEIGAEGSAIKLELDNDMIRFTRNGTPIGWWDGNDFHTGNLIVEVNERAQFGNFAFVPRTDGSLMLLKVLGGSLDNLFNIMDCDFGENVTRHSYIGTNGVYITMAAAADADVRYTINAAKHYRVSWTSSNTLLCAYNASGVAVYTGDGTDGLHEASISGAAYLQFSATDAAELAYSFRNAVVVEV